MISVTLLEKRSRGKHRCYLCGEPVDTVLLVTREETRPRSDQKPGKPGGPRKTRVCGRCVAEMWNKLLPQIPPLARPTAPAFRGWETE